MEETVKHRARLGALALGTLLAVASTGGMPNGGVALAQEGWTQLPQAQWTDEFSPLFVDSYGNLCEGDPNYNPTTGWETFEYQVLNPDTQQYEMVTAVENTVLVNFDPEVSANTIEGVLDDHDLQILTAWFDPDPVDPEVSMSWFNCAILPTSTYYDDVLGMVTALQSLSVVEFAEPNILVPKCQEFPDVSPDDTEFGNQPEFGRLNAPNAWKDYGYGDESTIGVVVLDIGVDVNHEDLSSKIYRHPTGDYRMGALATAKSFKFGDLATDPALSTIFQVTENSVTKKDAHGTAVAGIIGAETNNGTGVAACGPEIRVFPVAMENLKDSTNSYHTPTFLTSSMVNAIKGVKKNLKASKGIGNIRVANFSIGGTTRVASVIKAMKRDRKKNSRIYVAAGGNGSVEAKTWPAADPKILGVTGVDFATLGYDSKHLQTNFWCGSGQSAPDLNVYGISGYFVWSKTTDLMGSEGWVSGNYTSFSGTSAATPQIAALAALMISEDPSLTPAAVDTKIKASTKGSDYAVLSFTISGVGTKGIPAVVDFVKAMTPE